jgi:glycosyltransferase involved in cell wall biosynthesis
VVFTGTLAPKKGIQSLIRAWPLVREGCSDAVLHVYGKDGRTQCGEPMRENLEQELEGDTSVRFYGHVPHEVLFEALAAAAVAVFPSYSEAFGIAPLESMAHGCATVYTRCGSGPELIHDGVDGLLIDPADPKDIAQAIRRLLADPELAARLGAAGRQRVFREFACEVQVRRNEEYYAECMDRYRWN